MKRRFSNARCCFVSLSRSSVDRQGKRSCNERRSAFSRSRASGSHCFAPRSTRVGAAAVTQETADAQKLDAARAFGRERNVRDYAITSADGIDEGHYVMIGGIEQWITIRGEDRRNPVLLFLHGGPGDATNPWGYAAFRSWLKAFTVVQWDQRGTGRTLGRSGPSVAATITIDRMTQDGSSSQRCSAECSRRTGSSSSAIPGARFLASSWRRRGRTSFSRSSALVKWPTRPETTQSPTTRCLTRRRRLGEARAIRELREVGPPPYADGRGYAVQRRWSNLFEGADFFIASMVGLALTAPGYTLRDINDWFDGQNLSAERLVPQGEVRWV